MLHKIKLIFFCLLLVAGTVNTAFAETYLFTMDGKEVEIDTTSFADRVESFTAGANTALPYSDPQYSLGIPDYSGSVPLDPYEAVSLGDGGELVLEFTDNALTTSGDDTADLWVFEVGYYHEGTEVSISKDGVNWIPIGSIWGGTYGVDIDAYLGNGVELWEQYYFVKLTDLNEGKSDSPYAGADIDAVAAISNEILIDSHTPVAVTGPDQTVPEGDTVTLHATGSYDPDDDPITYLWEQVLGPVVTLSDNTDDQPTFIAPQVNEAGASLTFKLTVTDDGGLYSEALCIVNVTNIPGNIPPVANAGPDQENIVEGDTVRLDGSNSYDPDTGVIQSYAWTQISGVAVTLSSSSAIQPTFVAPYVGTSGDSLKFRLVVTDEGGLQSSDTCIVSVNGKNRSPIADAGDDQTVGPGNIVILNGSGSYDPDTGDVLKYRWRQISGTTVSLSDTVAVSPTFTAPLLTSDDVLHFELTVTDNGGLVSVDTCIVNVTSGLNQPPVADAGPDEMTVTEGATVTLDGSGSSDPNAGDEITYRWTQKSGIPVTLFDPLSAQPTFVAPAVGESGAELVFELTVTDKSGLQGVDSITVKITDTVPGPPGDDGGGDSGGGCFISSVVGFF
ncbi:MAG: REJ domain-containing protein [Desulfobacterales bacterium]